MKEGEESGDWRAVAINSIVRDKLPIKLASAAMERTVTIGQDICNPDVSRHEKVSTVPSRCPRSSPGQLHFWKLSVKEKKKKKNNFCAVDFACKIESSNLERIRVG